MKILAYRKCFNKAGLPLKIIWSSRRNFEQQLICYRAVHLATAHSIWVHKNCTAEQEVDMSLALSMLNWRLLLYTANQAWKISVLQSDGWCTIQTKVLGCSARCLRHLLWVFAAAVARGNRSTEWCGDHSLHGSAHDVWQSCVRLWSTRSLSAVRRLAATMLPGASLVPHGAFAAASAVRQTGRRCPGHLYAHDSLPCRQRLRDSHQQLVHLSEVSLPEL